MAQERITCRLISPTAWLCCHINGYSAFHTYHDVLSEDVPSISKPNLAVERQISLVTGREWKFFSCSDAKRSQKRVLCSQLKTDRKLLRTFLKDGYEWGICAFLNKWSAEKSICLSWSDLGFPYLSTQVIYPGWVNKSFKLMWSVSTL